MFYFIKTELLILQKNVIVLHAELKKSTRNIICYVIVINIIRENRIVKKYWFFFLLFPISQAFSILSAYQSVGHIDKRGLVGLILAPIADMLVLFLIISAQRKERVESELKRVRMLREAERIRNENMSRNQQAVLELKESLSKQFDQIKEAMQNSDCNIEQEWKQFEDVLESTRQSAYSGNSIVNAILSEKQKQCMQEFETEISISASLPREIDIDPMQMCSMFSNLLDNAMDAIAELEPEKRYIILETGCKAGNMWIKVENPASEEHVKREHREGHGYGRKILETIAKQHNGVFKTKFADGVYEASIIVEAEEAVETT